MGLAKKLFSLEGKTCLFTGATNGIGFSMAEALAEFGLKQIIYVRRPSTDPARLQTTLKAAAKENGNDDLIISEIVEDLATLKISEIEAKIFDKAIELSNSNKIDILINNAGISVASPFETYPDEQFDKVLHVNLRVPTKLSQLVGAHMIENKIKGKIVCTCSLYSFTGGDGTCSAYTVSKGGMKSLVQALSNEWAPKGICVNGLVPGVITTNMTQPIVNDKEKYAKFCLRIPSGDFGKPEDFKGAIIYLVSGASDYVTGTCLAVDGGYLSA